MIKIIGCMIILLLSSNSYALTVGTYNLPPFSMIEDREYIGLVTEAVQTLLKRADIEKYKFIDYPLARGLAELRAGRIDIFYPYVKDSKNAEQPYILIGPIARYSVALFVRKDYPNEVSLKAMQNLVLGAQRGSIEDHLIENYASRIDKTTRSISCLRMVLAQRISACAVGTLPGQYVAALNNLSPELKYENTGSYVDLYVALKHDIAADVEVKLKNAHRSLNKENYFAKQQSNYEKKFALFIKSLS